ncbi:hypothetical protein ANN_09421 [Periplaneta americana]|uniref:Uncharacterized protein n=1 Tax=Periplaneta americana TaxID=6978 RepID=A0ABQ8TL94_PERAM|nr:hypothetical protein ANN_09421 [Periplaneta americana]
MERSLISVSERVGVGEGRKSDLQNCSSSERLFTPHSYATHLFYQCGHDVPVTVYCINAAAAMVARRLLHRLLFRCPHRKKSQALRSGDLAGHRMSPLHRHSMEAVQQLFERRVMSRNVDIPLPARSPDLGVCDFFLWG